ncbi:TVP38/TMEM64 family protein [Corynebacterium oculi]|uniref:TVP38/TMEM64 family membrane protein n=1 Tax=Corynebacterium oculi TaxID=1544416 RepID=A0A0Q0UCC8_9CORY|nr:TVP38/TMEM64 family protein [Corynebacterium oculi]KQB85577.1 TVP38/TMEM64 family inner membrane protein YdjZ [Corynebacterium oculi]
MAAAEPARRVRDFLTLLLRDAWRAVGGWSWGRRLWVAVALACFLAVTLWAEVPGLSTLRAWSEHTGAWFPVFFWFLYVAITQFPIPRTVLTLASGVLFGPWWGVTLALSATTASAVVSLVLVRGLLGEWMRPRLRHPAVAGLVIRLERRGWLAVGSLRMIAGIPFSLLNYAAALSPVRVLPFAAATAVGSAPGTLAVVFLGDSLTGTPDSSLIAVLALLAVVGLAGLVVDRRLPVGTGR